MNYGFAIISNDGIYLEPFRSDPAILQFQLYDNALLKVAQQKSLQGQVLLEVSCGRGGCLNYLTEEYRPSQVYGVDLSPLNIAHCRK